MATVRISASAPIGGSAPAAPESQPAIRSVPPVVRKASLTGISDPSRIRIGQSTTSYASRGVRTRVSRRITAAPKNAIVTVSTSRSPCWKRNRRRRWLT